MISWKQYYGKLWFHYLKPRVLNCISRGPKDPKVYRWLCFVWTKGGEAGD